jgi:hypothetical protein
MMYTTRYVHKIAPRPADFGPDVEIPFGPLEHTSLARLLRSAGVLISGARVRDFRVTADGTIIVFPVVPGLSIYWHSAILTPKVTP